MAFETRWRWALTWVAVIAMTPAMADAAPIASGIEVPPNYLLAARHSDDFDTLEPELTAEGWFLFHALPPVDTRWMLLGKLGSYSMSLARGVWVGEDWIGITYSVREVHRDDGWLSASLSRSFHITKFPLGEWIHMALQVNAGGVVSAYFNGERLLEPAQLLRPMGRFDTPLYIGSVRGQRLGEAGFFAPDSSGTWVTLDGRVDNVRLSSVFRYAGDFKPSRTWPNDRDTLAFWRLDEPPTARTLADSSGNGHTLRLFSSLPVPDIGSVAMLWGGIKSLR